MPRKKSQTPRGGIIESLGRLVSVEQAPRAQRVTLRPAAPAAPTPDMDASDDAPDPLGGRFASCDRWPDTFVIAGAPDSSRLSAQMTAELERVKATYERVEPVHVPGAALLPGCPAKHCHQLGLVLAHLNVWLTMVERRLPWAIIFEQDVLFHDGFCALAPDYWRQLPDDWEMVYLGLLDRLPHRERNLSVQRLGRAPWTTHAYAIRLPLARQLASLQSYFLMRFNLSRDLWKRAEHLLPWDAEWASDVVRVYEPRSNATKAPRVVVSSDAPTAPWAATVGIAKIDFFLNTAFNHFLRSRDRARWLGFFTTAAHKPTLRGRALWPWTGRGLIDDSGVCGNRLTNGRRGASGICSLWSAPRCHSLGLPIMAEGLVFQHLCKERDVTQLPQWFSDSQRSRTPS
eukprot:6210195-Prymnesium_polylepis.1